MNVVKVIAAALLLFAQSSAVAEELRSSPVYVDPAAERADDVDEKALEERIAEAGVPIFIAILPASAGDPEDVVTELETDVGLTGVYAVVVGGAFRAAGSAADEATAAFQAERDAGVQAVLEEFVDRVDGGGAPSGTGDEGGGSRSSFPLLAVLVLGGVGLFVWSRSKRRQVDAEEERAEQADRQMLRAELAVLADDVMRLEPEVALRPEARADYEAAVSRSRAAEAALDYADDRVDLVRVERVVLEARYAMDRARARIEGREPPPPPDDLRRRGAHDEPAIDLDDRRDPVYVGYPAGGWYGGGGWFGGGGGMLTGLLLGSMLGGGFGGWGHDHGGDGGDGGGFGDFGGGDFGGGDFGGGDFGGGDFD